MQKQKYEYLCSVFCRHLLFFLLRQVAQIVNLWTNEWIREYIGVVSNSPPTYALQIWSKEILVSYDFLLTHKRGWSVTSKGAGITEAFVFHVFSDQPGQDVVVVFKAFAVIWGRTCMRRFKAFDMQVLFECKETRWKWRRGKIKWPSHEYVTCSWNRRAIRISTSHN